MVNTVSKNHAIGKLTMCALIVLLLFLTLACAEDFFSGLRGQVWNKGWWNTPLLSCSLLVCGEHTCDLGE